jgi:hypothetical protein
MKKMFVYLLAFCLFLMFGCGLTHESRALKTGESLIGKKASVLPLYYPLGYTDGCTETSMIDGGKVICCPYVMNIYITQRTHLASQNAKNALSGCKYICFCVDDFDRITSTFWGGKQNKFDACP